MCPAAGLIADLPFYVASLNLQLIFHIRSHTRPTPLAIRPDAPPPPVEQKRHRHKKHREAPEDRVAPIHADVMIHGPHEQGERAREHGPQEHVGRNGAGAVAREGVDEVVER